MANSYRRFCKPPFKFAFTFGRHFSAYACIAPVPQMQNVPYIRPAVFTSSQWLWAARYSRCSQKLFVIYNPAVRDVPKAPSPAVRAVRNSCSSFIMANTYPRFCKPQSKLAFAFGRHFSAYACIAPVPPMHNVPNIRSFGS